MKTANIAELKNALGHFLAAVEKGEEVEIRRRNLPVARLVPVTAPAKNRTVLGLGSGTATIHGDLLQPQMPESDWEMLDGESA